MCGSLSAEAHLSPGNGINNIIKKKQEASIDLLPNELLEHILLFLPSIWWFICKFVCSRWRLLLAQFPTESDRSFITFAAAGGYVKILKWAKRHGFKWDKWKCRLGDFEALNWKWPKWNIHPWGCSNVIVGAAHGGHLELLKWARRQGCRWKKYYICWIAALGGQLALLKWARKQGYYWDIWTCAGAACGGHLEVLKWARSQGCPWDERTCASAAYGGHLEVLQWLRSQGCPWSETTCEAAAEGGHLELQWARSRGCPCWREAMYYRAVHKGHSAVVQWLRSEGYYKG